MIRANHLLWVVALALALNACAADKLVVTGDTLLQLGNQFVDTAAVMDKALDAGVITKVQYKDWSVFGKKFQLVYPKAVAMWRLAKDSKDPALEANMVAVIADLATELAVYSGVEVK